MNFRIRNFILLILFNLLSVYFELVVAQTPQNADTTKKNIRSDVAVTNIDSTRFEGEIELIEINIEAVIEKPRVAILPKRSEPELGEMEFIDRSFESELKQAPTKPMILDDRLFVPKKIEDLKQKLLEKKEKLDKNK